MLMEDRVEQAKRKNRKYNPDRRWVNISEISKEILRAVVIAEDSTFFQHRGIEFAEWKFALYEAITQFKFPRGASTITQQLAKNIYLYNDGLINRKIKEILMARRLEKDLTKKRILELYLNIIEWGDGIFGVEAASKHYFNKSASEIDRGQAAFLAAIIPSPIGAFNPKKHPERVADRADLILLRMNTVITLKY